MTSSIPCGAGVSGRVLVADDMDENRRMLRDILEAQGHRVLLAEDGQQALEKALTDRPDVVLLDVMMPGMDGYEVCRQLRKDPRTAHIPVLMVTSLKDRADRLMGIRAGTNDFLTKPIDAEEIRLRVKNAVLTKQLYDKVQDNYARLRELEDLRDKLTHMIVHDLRSPLMAMSGSFEIILTEPERLSPDQVRFCRMGRDACLEQIEMVTSLLDISRMEARQMPLNRIPCDIRKIAEVAVESVAALATEKDLTLSVTGDSPSIHADRDMTHRIFGNLLGNAIKFSPKGGTIGVALSHNGEALQVRVTDQGKGIPPEYHQRVFEKFGQVESRKYSSGLGLTFCKLAVEAHGGQIGLESEVGKGSTFWFTLPEKEDCQKSDEKA